MSTPVRVNNRWSNGPPITTNTNAAAAAAAAAVTAGKLAENVNKANKAAAVAAAQVKLNNKENRFIKKAQNYVNNPNNNRKVNASTRASAKAQLAALNLKIANGSATNNNKTKATTLRRNLLTNNSGRGIANSLETAGLNSKMLKSVAINVGTTKPRDYFTKKANDILQEIDNTIRVIESFSKNSSKSPQEITDFSKNLKDDLTNIVNKITDVRNEFLSALKQRFGTKDSNPRVYFFNATNVPVKNINNINKTKFAAYETLVNSTGNLNKNRNKNMILNIINPATNTKLGIWPTIMNMDKTLMSLDFYIKRRKSPLSNTNKGVVQARLNKEKEAADQLSQNIDKIGEQLALIRAQVVGGAQ
jgi:hypothetical protein